jgi:uncharacterized protein YjiS (DUF1127 family)
MTVIARDSNAFLLPHNLMYVGADRGAQDVPSRALPESERGVQARGLKRALTNLAGWLIEMPARRAAVTELSAMSDRELADIGLHRADIRAVVARDFAARHQAA